MANSPLTITNALKDYLMTALTAEIATLNTAQSIARLVGKKKQNYNISASTNTFMISVDGGAEQTVTLTQGAARTAQNIVDDINTGTTGITASVLDSRVLLKSDTIGDGSGLKIGFGTSNSIIGFLDTDKDYCLTLSDIVSSYYDESEEILPKENYPCLIVKCLGVNEDVPVKMEQFTYEFVTSIFAFCDSLDLLRKQLYLYGEAIRNVIIDDRTLAGQVAFATVSRIDLPSVIFDEGLGIAGGFVFCNVRIVSEDV